MFLSISYGSTAPYADGLLHPVIDRFTWFAAAGNNSTGAHNCLMNSKFIFGVGAVELSWSQMYADGTPVPGATATVRPAYYSSESEHVDFCAPTNVKTKVGNSEIRFTGTSCACPVLCGMAALVNDMFIDKTGYPLGCMDMYKFLEDCAADIQAVGHDNKTGWGYIVLPPPESVDVWKYQSRGKIVNEKEDDMTGQEIYEKLNEYLSTQALPDWARSELQEAIDAGITDGTNPMQLVPRYQSAIMCKRMMKGGN